MKKPRQLPLIRFTRTRWRPRERQPRSFPPIGRDTQQKAFQFPTGHPVITYELKPQEKQP